ncbi:hypothetical protein HPP92_004180 [Vanilla planifolia]|uniref:Uncharacterized protein n=1 Tax=Vanilla planifolia TaxID=51239 RepID=A0A835RWE9_VANPL|nr:hypothetical protein HPP92_004180 [Vanilla planifolia]
MQNSSQPLFILSNGHKVTAGGPASPVIDEIEADQIVVPVKNGWKNLFAFIGPGFLVSIAYIDPGNFKTDLQSGAQYKYELLWIILVALIAALVIQSLAAKLGVVKGKHLAEHCRAEYPKAPNFVLWLLAELAVVASDIPEVIGTAFALDMLFSIPVWCGVLITGLSTMVLLFLQNYGVRKLEFVISFLVFTIAACFMAELGYAKPPFPEVLKGLFIPKLKGNGSTGLAISLLGAMVMPHNLFLHSALVLSRKVHRSATGLKEACKLYTVESAIALGFAFLINVSIISLSGVNALGKWSSTLFAISLLASGQSSTITGTYSGQYVMQGFLNLQLTPWKRNILTRSLAIIPSLIAVIISGSSGAGKLIIVASMMLSFELPFALLPLLKFTSSKAKMGPYVNSPMLSAATWAMGSLLIAINVYYIISAFFQVLLKGQMQTTFKAIVGICGFSALFVYLAAIVYLIRC